MNFNLPEPAVGRIPAALKRVVLLLVLTVCFVTPTVWATIDINLQMQLGNPSGATADPNNHDHYLIQRTVEAFDYSANLGEATWASWDLTTNDVGSSGRVGTFVPDTNLPPGFYEVKDADYNGDSTDNIDRGHLCPSDDRTDNTNDNQLVFFMSNVFPQASANNEGVWATFEGFCRSLATNGNEMLIICGPAGFGTNLLPSGAPIIIPTNTWKIAVAVPQGAGTALSRITTATRIIALIIPNNNNVTNNWTNYVTSASQVEALTGFTFFTAVPPLVASALRSKVDGQTNPAPHITSFSPTNGVGGTSVIINGSNFPSTSVVSFNGVNAIFTVNSSTQITATVPTNATSGLIQVTTPSGTGTSPAVFTVNNSGGLAVITQQPQSVSLLIGQNATFTVGATSSTPLGYQWQYNSNNIPQATATNLTIANVQLSDAGNYRVLITNASGTVTSAVATLTVSNLTPTVIAQWNFDVTNTATQSSPVASLGTGTITLAGGTSGSFVSGGGPSDTNATNNAWNTTTYGSATTGNKTRGANFAINTVGYRSLSVSWDGRLSATASKYFRLQYTTNGTTYLDGPLITMNTNSAFESETNDLSALPGVNNNSNFAFRVVAEFESTAIGSANANYVTTSASGFSSAGTVRFDMMTLYGVAVPTNVPPPVLSSATLSGSQFDFNVRGVGGLNYVVQVSSNLTSWTPLQTNVSPFSFNDTNNQPRRFYRAQYLP